MLITELARHCDAQPRGGDASLTINSAADIMSAHAHQVTVLSDSKYKKYLKDSKASACFIAASLAESDFPGGMTLLICKDPEISFLTAVKLLHPEQPLKRQVSEHAVLADTTTLGFDVHVGPFASIGQHSSIGDSSTIEAGVRIGNHVAIGKNCRIHPNAVIYDHCVIGNDVIIHAGAIIGA
ncbi:MAG: LpxD N-terminal domain-containing protein, partial [Methylomonas sp.]